MNIQQKNLWIAAYEGFVHNTKTKKYRTVDGIGSPCRKKMLMVWNDIQCYPSTLPTSKQCNKEMVSNKIYDYIQVTWIYGKYLLIVMFHTSTLHYNTFWIWGCITLIMTPPAPEEWSAALISTPSIPTEELVILVTTLLYWQMSWMTATLPEATSDVRGPTELEYLKWV